VTYGVPTDLSTILLAIQNKLVATDLLFPLEHAIITLAIDESLDRDPPTDSFVVFGQTNAPIDQALVMGGGDLSMGTNANISMRFWNRYEAGWFLSDAQALTDSTLGLLANWRKILKSLQLFSPVDSMSGNCILEEPMRFLNWMVEPRRAQSPWLVIRSVIEAKFVQDLS
jgi:hypothetical protein